MMRANRFFFIIITFLIILPLGANQKIRKYLQAGDFWYPGSKPRLEGMLNQLFQQTRKLPIEGRIRGLVAPHAGYTISGLCAARGFKQLQGIEGINRVFILGVAHRGRFYGACVSDFTHNATPLGNMVVDTRITQSLSKEPFFQTNNRVMQHEHSIENQLPFLQWIFKGKSIQIIPVLFGALQPQDINSVVRTLRKYIDHRTLVIASTDFTHYGRAYGYVPFSQDIKNKLSRLDKGMIRPILNMDLKKCQKYKEKTGITMCGFTPVSVLMALFPRDNHKGKLIDYYKSADINGDYSFSVSYAAIAFYKMEKTRPPKKPEGISRKDKGKLLALARRSIKYYLQNNEYWPGINNQKNLAPILKQKAGVFVTLKIADRLRGCIGSIVGVDPLYQGVIKNAVNAAVKDPRFSPLGPAELSQVHIEISVMSPLQRIKNYKRIRLGTDGVIIKKDYCQAVFLPQVASETGWNLDQFLSALCRKAGLHLDDYRKGGMEFYIFQAQVFGESH